MMYQKTFQSVPKFTDEGLASSPVQLPFPLLLKGQSHCALLFIFDFKSFVVPEEAREEVVDFFQRRDPKETNCEGWILLKSLLLLTADSSVSDNHILHSSEC